MKVEVISKSILAAAGTDVDWISVPDDQRVISDEMLDWIASEVEQLFEEDPEETNKENLAHASKRLKTKQYASVDKTSTTNGESFYKYSFLLILRPILTGQLELFRPGQSGGVTPQNQCLKAF